MSEVRESNVEAVIARVKAVYGRWGRQTTVADMRADWDRLFAAHGDARTADTMAGEVPCRWVAAPGAREDRVVVYFHGGGFQVGSLDSHRELMAVLSYACGARVLGVGYRLAPEHRYPAALDDALAVVDGLRAEGFDASQIALAGDSAGAGLALSTLIALQRAGRPLPVAAYLMSAWTDLTAAGSSYETRAALDPIHQRPMILAMARNYLGKERDPNDPLASPLMASAAQLGGLPPLLLQVGERETVVSDSERLVDKVVAAGGQAELQIWPGMIHVFQQFPGELPEARAALQQGGRFLAARLGIELHRKHAS
jgi:acetyl esterase/lipase